MTKWLKRQGYKVNRKRVARLMRRMGLQGVTPKRKLSWPNKEHKVYPYLLKGLHIAKPNHVFCSDITYIPMRKGFIYLTAVMDWHSRYVLSWKVSLTLDAAFCVEALEEALAHGVPEIFNTDQGSQFTSKDFTNVLKNHRIAISMDGKGGSSTTFSLRGSGGLSSTRRSISKTTPTSGRPYGASETSSAATTRNGRTRLSATGPLMRFTMGRLSAPKPTPQTEEGIHLKHAS